MNVDFKEIKDYFYNNRYRDNTTRKYAGMFEKVSQIIDENDILHFYPKYLFVDEQILQLYFILKNNKFIKVWINGDKHIVIEYFNINKIKSATFECPLDDYGDYRLTLFFEEKVEEITFNSKEDTNEHWMRIPDYSDSISGSIRTIKPDTVFAAAKCQKADGIACPKNDGYNIHIIEKGKALLF